MDARTVVVLGINYGSAADKAVEPDRGVVPKRGEIDVKGKGNVEAWVLKL